MIVTGIEHCKFTNKEGKEITFDRLTLLEDIPFSKGQGRSAVIVNCSPEKTDGLSLGDEIEVLYNRFGKVMRFDLVG